MKIVFIAIYHIYIFKISISFSTGNLTLCMLFIPDWFLSRDKQITPLGGLGQTGLCSEYY